MKEQPNDKIAELFIIGCCLVDGSCIGELCEIISENDFYVKLYGDIFEVCKKLYGDGHVVDVISVNNLLQANDTYKKNGGATILTKAVDNIQSVAGFRHHAGIIREKSLLRRTVKVALAAMDAVNSGETEAKDILETAQADLFALASANIQQKLLPIDNDLVEAVKDIEFLYSNQGDVPGLATGFRGVDRKTGGLQKGELIIIAGRPSMGKTAFALNIAEQVAAKGNGVAIFSLEMSRRLLVNRLISSAASMPANKIKYGNLQSSDWANLGNGIKKLKAMPIFIDDSVDMTAFDIRARARNVYNQLNARGKRLELILIDYLQLLKGDVRLKDKNVQVADISRQIKSLARDLDVPVIALSQLSRATEMRGVNNSKPVLSDLRDSGAIEQDADIVMFLWREGYYKRNEPDKAKNATVIIGKNRNGSCGEVEMIFEAEYTRFYDREL